MPKYRVKVTLTETRTKVVKVEAPHADAAFFSVMREPPPSTDLHASKTAIRAEIIGEEKPR